MGTVAAFRDHPSARHIAGKRILLVEDDADIRKMLRIVLEAIGAAVTEAGSPKQTIAALQQASSVDAIVLDWYLAGATGDRLLAEIATLSPPYAGPVLVISGDQRVSAAASRSATKIAVLVKPFLPIDLVVALGGLLATEP